VSTEIERPLFFENQILGAADLTATVEHGRGQQARHNRYLHLWGIASGLELTGEDDEENNEKFKRITLSAGMAIDGNGREIVVSQSGRLSENTFSQLQLTGGQDPDTTWYPVLLVGKDTTAQQPPFNTGACNSSAPSRKVERYEVTFRRMSEARKLNEQTGSQVSDGPGNGGWMILLGFVKANKSGDKFTDFKYEESGIGRRYAGVQADEVAARGGSLKLRTQTTSQANKPALILDETKDGLLQFGSLDAKGILKPVFSVNAKGDVTAEGKIIGALAKGVTQVESGIAMDGMILPLPPGVTQTQVTDGDAIIQTQISLRFTGEVVPPGNTSGGQWGAFPLEAWVDSDRRVHCRLRWMKLAGGAGLEDHPAACDYVVLASLKEKPE
jgi:hypothetical protein